MNGGASYLLRKQAAEAFASEIKAAANNPAIGAVYVMQAARKIVVDPVAADPFTIENNNNTAEQLAAAINARL